MRYTGVVLCVALLGGSARAQSVEVDPSLPSYRPVAGVIGVIRGHSSAGMGDLMRIWGGGFQRVYPNVRVELDDAGVDLAVGGAATFGPWLGMIGEPTVGEFKSRFGYATPAQIPVCLYVLGVHVREDNPLRGGLRMDEVLTIFSLEFWEVRWGDLGCRGEWSERPIKLYAPHRMDSERVLELRGGFREIGARKLAAFLGFKDSVKEIGDEAAVLTTVAEDIGAMGLASIGRRTDKVRAIEIAPLGSSRFVGATAENAWNGSYPLVEPFYLVLNHDVQGGLEIDPLRREFLRYILSREGQQAVVEAGYVPVSAEIAERSLSQVGLTPSGEGSWDRMMRRLRARELPREVMGRIQRLTQTVGDRPTREQLGRLASALIGTRLTSSVTFETDDEGAVIKYRIPGQQEVMSTDGPTPSAKATVPIGLYCVWTERDGTATSPPDAWFEIIQEHERVKICEARIDFRGAAARVLRATMTYFSWPLTEMSLAEGWTPERQRRMEEWCKNMLLRVEARDSVDYERARRDLERELDSWGIQEGTLRDLCISTARELELLREDDDR